LKLGSDCPENSEGAKRQFDECMEALNKVHAVLVCGTHLKTLASVSPRAKPTRNWKIADYTPT